MEQLTGFTVANRTVEFDIAPTADVLVTIYRVTPTEPLVGWADASVMKALDMTVAQVQQLHIIEESRDWSTLNSIVLGTAGDAWEGRGYRIQNVADPQNPQDVVTKKYMETVETGFIQQNTALMQEAKKQAGIATTKAGEASSSASQAAGSAVLAQKWAENLDSPDGTTSKSSKTWAVEASSSANASASSAQSASNSASAANLSAQTATNKANEASTSASQAASSAQVAAQKAEAASISASQASTYAVNASNSASDAAQSKSAAATSADAAAQSASNAAQSASESAASAEEAKNAAGGIGNPVRDVTEANGTVTITKSNGTSNSILVLTPSMKNQVNGVAGLTSNGKLSNTVYNFATQAEAEAGTNNTKPMTAANVKQAITKSLLDLDYVVDSFRDGPTWYRRYKSGWVEQGGIFRTATDNPENIINLNVAMKDSDYYANGVVLNGYVFALNATEGRTTTTIKYGVANLGSSWITNASGIWFACGQGA